MTETISRNYNFLKTFFKKWIFANYLFHLIPFVDLTAYFKFFLNNLFCLFIFLWFLTSILMVIISLELTRVNLDRNIFLINCGTNIYFFPIQRFGPSPSPNFRYYCISRVFIYYFTYYHNIIIFNNYKVHLLLRLSYYYE